MDEKTILETLWNGERVTLECKRAERDVPKSVWETYSAFANTYGGLILLGIYEDLKEKNAYSGDIRSPIPAISVHLIGNLQYRRQS